MNALIAAQQPATATSIFQGEYHIWQLPKWFDMIDWYLMWAFTMIMLLIYITYTFEAYYIIAFFE